MSDFVEILRWYESNKDLVNHLAGVNGPIGLVGLAYLVKAVLRIEAKFSTLADRVGGMEKSITKLNDKLASIVEQVKENRSDIDWIFTRQD